MLQDKTPTTLPGQMFWSVTAVDELGNRRLGWDPGIEFFSSRTDFWAGAALVAAAQFEKGTGVSGLEPTATETVVHLNLDRREPVRTTKACFAVPPNTVGVSWWWGSRADAANIRPEDFQETLFDPNVSAEFPLCTPELTVTADNMVLVVRGFSNVVQGQAAGFGPFHVYYADARYCGEAGDVCCADTPPDPCAPDTAWCVDGQCKTCGRQVNQPCCRGTSCDLGPSLTCKEAICVECGDAPEPCCKAADAAGLEGCGNRVADCSSGACELCINKQCTACGGPGQPCCPPSNLCRAGACNNGKCETPKPCNSTVQAGSVQGRTVSINVGKAQGETRLQYETLCIPDRMVVRNDSGAIVFDTECTATNAKPYSLGCPNVSGSFGCCPTTNPLSTQCWRDFNFSSPSGILTVEVLPDCGPSACPSGDTTQWAFMLQCAD